MRWFWLILIGVQAVPAAILFAMAQQGGLNAPTPAPQELSVPQACLRLNAVPPDYSALDQTSFRRAIKDWTATCRQALAADDADPRLKLSLARALTSEGQRPEAVTLLRAAAAQGIADASYELFEMYKSWERGDVNRTQIVTRAEADWALHHAAELGHPAAMLGLAVRLDRGEIVKRDPAAARLWAERALANPPKDWRVADMQVLLGRLLAASDKADERARGLDLLEQLGRSRGDAKAELGKAIRGDDPVRARALLEEAQRSYPGHAIPPLADMLRKGEGGPADPKRAVSLLTGRMVSDIPAVKAALGRLYAEGVLVPRDLTQAVRLLAIGAQFDQKPRLEAMKLLAENPDLRLEYASSFLFDATEAASLDEPGAVAALVALKLSQNMQFRDKAGGCALVADALKRGDDSFKSRAQECGAG